MAKALKKIFRQHDKPEILDLGPLSGPTAVFLADLGARVSVEEFDPPRPPAEPDPDRPDEEPAAPEPLRFDQPDGRFDLVLAWEAFDFTPPDRIAELGAEVKRILVEGGLVLLLSRNTTGARKAPPEVRGRFRMEAEDRLVRQPAGHRAQPRWVHPTRDLERALKPLSIQGIHLQRDQTREILALRKKARPPAAAMPSAS